MYRDRLRDFCSKRDIQKLAHQPSKRDLLQKICFFETVEETVLSIAVINGPTYNDRLLFVEASDSPDQEGYNFYLVSGSERETISVESKLSTSISEVRRLLDGAIIRVTTLPYRDRYHFDIKLIDNLD